MKTNQLTTVERPESLEWVGGVNDLPPNFEEITEDFLVEFTKFGTYYPTYVDHKQANHNGERLHLTLQVFHDDTGIAFATDSWTAYDRRQGRDSDRAKLPAIRWFRFARCLHEYGPGHKLGNCYYRYTCTKCGYEKEVDSSD